MARKRTGNLVNQVYHFQLLKRSATLAFTQPPFKLSLGKARKCAEVFLKTAGFKKLSRKPSSRPKRRSLVDDPLGRTSILV